MHLQISKLAKTIFLTSIVLLLINVLLAGVFWQKLPPQIPLFYSKPWGQDQLVSPSLLAIPLGVGFLSTVVTFLLVKIVQDTFFQNIVLLGMLISITLITISLIRILYLVF